MDIILIILEFILCLKAKKYKNKTAVVLGAGGACKAVITYLLDNDVEKIYIVSRNPKNINLNKDNKKNKYYKL